MVNMRNHNKNSHRILALFLGILPVLRGSMGRPEPILSFFFFLSVLFLSHLLSLSLSSLSSARCLCYPLLFHLTANLFLLSFFLFVLLTCALSLSRSLFLSFILR